MSSSSPTQRNHRPTIPHQEVVARQCGGCALWKLDPAEKMTAHGYGLCPHLPTWQYTAAHMPCQTQPLKFKEKP